MIDTDLYIMISYEDEGDNEEYKGKGFRSVYNILFLLRKVLNQYGKLLITVYI